MSYLIAAIDVKREFVAFASKEEADITAPSSKLRSNDSQEFS
jgi:hypothetical protein